MQPRITSTTFRPNTPYQSNYRFNNTLQQRPQQYQPRPPTTTPPRYSPPLQPPQQRTPWAPQGYRQDARMDVDRAQSGNVPTGGRGPQCYNCGRFGHLSRECRAPRQSSARAMTQGPQCYKCGQFGHMQRDCRNQKTNASISWMEQEDYYKGADARVVEELTLPSADEPNRAATSAKDFPKGQE